MEATALSVGKSVVNGALSYAKSAVAEEVALQLGVQRDQAFITDELEMMQAFLMAAHQEKDDDKVVKTWVKQVRDVAYDVEDCLQDFAVRLQKSSWWRIPFTLLDRHHIAKQMKELRAKVEDVSQRNVRYRLIRGSGSKTNSTTEQPTIDTEALLQIAAATRTALQEKKRVGLAELITTKDRDDIRVIAVWGASSDLGVTSIIRAAYDNENVKREFKCRAWVRLMHPFSPDDFFVSLVRQFCRQSCEGTGKSTEGTCTGTDFVNKMADHDSLVNTFNQYVTEEKYLVVINDVCTIEEWDWIKMYFPNKNGSRIIVSTQQFEVASLCTEQPYTVSEINQSWSFDKDFYVFYKKENSTAKEDKLKPQSCLDGTGSIVPTGVTTTGIQEDPATKEDNPTPHSSNEDTVTGLGGATEEIQVEIRANEDGTPGASSNAPGQPSDGELVKNPTSAVMAASEDDRLIDRKAAKAKIKELVDQDGSVIAICGMGGLGKTTLARNVYQQELGEMFERRAWLTLSLPFSRKEFLGDLFRQLHSDDREQNRRHSESSDKEDKSKPKTEEELIKELTRILSQKKCLIVLDDVSSSKDCQFVSKLLPKSRHSASRIIVTTRQADVGKSCCGEATQVLLYNLDFLNEEESLLLFEKKVFRNDEEKGNFRQNLDMKEQAKLILKKCDGLPLAISIIGSLLATKPRTAMEWRNLNKHISAELEINSELGMIKTVLNSSYTSLPYYLKACFLYLSIFPEDHNIRWARLVRRWIAEGYSRGIRNMTAEEIGHGYLMELINRTMVQPSKAATRRTTRIGFLQVHDLIREIGISKAAEESLVITLEEGCKINTHGKFRHLAVSSGWKRDKDTFESALDLSYLRSLSVFGKWESFFISDKMRFLRVLDLEDTKGITDDHLHEICQLFHLNYLSLRRCDGILRLPNSLGNLRHLQTLDIRDTEIINLPRTIIKLEKLRYVRLGFIPKKDDEQRGMCAVVRMGHDCFEFCRPRISCCGVLDLINSFDVPEVRLVCMENSLAGIACLLLLIGFGPLYLLYLVGLFLWVLMIDGFDGLPASFKGLRPHGVKFPTGTRKLKALHSVGIVNIDGGNAILKDLQYLTELRKLKVTGLNKKNCKKFFSAIGDKECLESLLVRSEGKPGLAGCFDGVYSRPNNLQSLKLYGNLVQLPEWWIKGLQNLVKLELRSSRISKHDEAIEFLGKLPNLAILRLLKESFSSDGISLSFHDGAFPSLVVLELSLRASISSKTIEYVSICRKRVSYTYEYPGELERVKFEEGAAPKLEVLMFSSTSYKTGLFSGLPSLPSLKEFMLDNKSYGNDFVEDLRSQLAENPGGPILKRYDNVDNYGRKRDQVIRRSRWTAPVLTKKLQSISLEPLENQPSECERRRSNWNTPVIRRMLQFIGLAPLRLSDTTESIDPCTTLES